MLTHARSWTNLTGLLLSAACVVHCMLMPLCLASLPSWGLSWLVSPWVHQLLALLGLGIGVGALVPGWRQHRRARVLVLAFIGLGVMNYAAFFGDECCAVPASGTGATSDSSSLPHCCQQGACSVSSPSQSSIQSTSPITGTLAHFGSWLQAHPTAIGAALLAWAHCLNGSCVQSCCQTGPKEVVALGSIT